MEVTVKFHGIIGDMLSRKTQYVEMPEGATIDDLLVTLTEGDDRAQSVLKQTRAFIDGKQADRAAPLAAGAEVIFMRPIAGGRGCRGDRGFVSPDPLVRRWGREQESNRQLPVTLTPYFDAVEPGGRLRPPVDGSGCAPGT